MGTQALSPPTTTYHLTLSLVAFLLSLLIFFFALLLSFFLPLLLLSAV